jgi:antitoxin (DNA-binding transcriptional repressor) of toxin-antitoxin stability system
MKVIPPSKAKANLSHYGRLRRDEPVIVTVNGAAAFQLAPLDEDDDLIDSLLVSPNGDIPPRQRKGTVPVLG